MRCILVRRDNPTPERMCDLYSFSEEDPSTIYRWDKSYQSWYELAPTAIQSLRQYCTKNRYGVMALGQSIMLNGMPSCVNGVTRGYVALNSDIYTNDDLLRIAPNYDGSGFVNFDGLTKPKKYFGKMPKFRFV